MKANRALDDGLEGMRECIAYLRGELRDGYDADKASELALLCHKVAQIMDSCRKRENDESKYELSPRILAEYLRKLTPEQRAAHIRDVQALDRSGSVLA